MKTIFITGASAGIGKATAKLFASKGWKVLAAMRRPEEEQELNLIENTTVLKLDVTSEAEIIHVVKSLTKEHKVDVVFNNAGYGLMGPVESTTDEQIQRQISTNLLGPIRVIKEFIPHLRQNKGGIFITTTSLGGLVTFPFSSLYHATKWGVEGFSESLSFELAQFGIQVKTISPAGTATDFTGRSKDLSHNEAYPNFQKILDILEGRNSGFTFSTTDSIADVVYEAATDGKDQLRYLAGEGAKETYEQRLKIGAEEFRKNMAHILD